MKHRIGETRKDPWPWWLYPATVAGGLLTNLWERGLSPATVRGGLVGGVIGLLLLWGLRCVLVRQGRERDAT